MIYFYLKMKGKTLRQQLDMLADAIVEQRKHQLIRDYNRHVIKFHIDLDYIQYDGFPRITMWSRHVINLTLPKIFKFFFVKNYEKHGMSPEVTIQKMRNLSWEETMSIRLDFLRSPVKQDLAECI